MRLGNIGFVEGHHDGIFATVQLAEDALLELFPAAGIDDHHPHVGAVEHLPRLLRPAFRPAPPRRRRPAVSMNSTGPSGNSSIGFSTGSVVVPAISETIETSCRVIAFRSDDLPALRRPNKPM